MFHRRRFVGISLVTILLAATAADPQDSRGPQRLDGVIAAALGEGLAPGAVLLVGQGDRTLHFRAYGSRSFTPERLPMRTDVIFDCASLTKVVVTATAVMMLVEEGRVRLDEPVTQHLPGFARGQSRITIRQLLTHTSGLRPDLDLEPVWSGYETGVSKAYQERPTAAPEERFIYSDINFLLLAELVRVVTGERIDEFARRRIFEPLGMWDSGFLPPLDKLDRVAPTELLSDGRLLHGVVHDPTTRYMDGVAGHAGMFSTAADLARFCQMMLNGGRLGEVRLLSPLAIRKMTTPQTPPEVPPRGLGWDIDSPYASVRGGLYPVGSYGHTGFTGASIWIDPTTRSYVILLTNRVHPAASTSVVSLRSQIASAAAAWVSSLLADDEIAAAAGESGAERLTEVAPVRTGLDVLAAENFRRFRGLRVGLITNHTGIDGRGRRNIDLFYEAPGVTLSAIFSPEHGLAGSLDQSDIADAVDQATGVPVYSLYRGDSRRPDPALLDGLDALVFDIQDIGARFYTYITTMAYAMEAAAEAGLPFYVLDRPNPINGLRIEGPPLAEELRSFVGYFDIPARHGMTVGELANMFRRERRLEVRLEVVRLDGWRREMWFDQTGLPWVNPSPNIRNLTEATLYPGIALVEGLRNLSVGRGTDQPFEFVGADWLEAAKLTAALREARLPGLSVYPATRTPMSSVFAQQPIGGVQILLLDRERAWPTRLGLELARALVQLGGDRVKLEQTARLLGDPAAVQTLENSGGTEGIWERWTAYSDQFRRRREPSLLY